MIRRVVSVVTFEIRTGRELNVDCIFKRWHGQKLQTSITIEASYDLRKRYSLSHSLAALKSALKFDNWKKDDLQSRHRHHLSNKPMPSFSLHVELHSRNQATMFIHSQLHNSNPCSGHKDKTTAVRAAFCPGGGPAYGSAHIVTCFQDRLVFRPFFPFLFICTAFGLVLDGCHIYLSHVLVLGQILVQCIWWASQPSWTLDLML